MRTIKRLFQPPSNHYFIFGPRGTGKTTWLDKTYTDAIKIDLLRPDLRRTYQTHPEYLEEVLKAATQKIIVIDEIQLIPELLSVVHRWIEKKQGIQFILTGSSSRKLKKTGTDLLGGRALKTVMHPFMACELEDGFSLEESLALGMLPLVVDSPTPKETLDTYINLYLDDEIAKEGWVRNLGQFSRFLEAISFSHSSVINLSNVSRECEVKRKTVEGYLEILKDILLAFTIPVFTKKAQRKMSSHPKFYLFDTGVYNSLRPKGPLDKPEEIQGTALEGLVAQHLKAWIDYSNFDADLFFWRTQAGSEIDFVVYGQDIFMAIEVKNAKKIYSNNLRHLKTFKKDYPQAKTILLYRGEDKIKKENILCLPCEKFLKELKPSLMIPCE